MNRLVCIVEGEGEVQAFPKLCYRILAYLKITGWLVGERAMRYPRSRLVDGKSPGPRRPCLRPEVERVVRLAQQAERASAVLMLCDADDDCPATWGPDASAVITSVIPGAAVMAYREYEAWLLWNRTEDELKRFSLESPDSIRDAKGAMKHFVSNYRPTAHQLAETQRLDIDRVRARSDSFDKLVRTLAAITREPIPSPSGRGSG